MAIASYSLAALAVLLAIPVALFCLEAVVATVLPRRKGLAAPSNDFRQRVAVLVPAHNESTGLLRTIEDVKAQLRNGDRLLVVADNCTDDTATVAAAAGADVIERNEPDKVGKGYALDWGVRHLNADPREIVIVVDADCWLAAGAIESLRTTCAVTHRPVQALYLMTAPEQCSFDCRVAQFAWRVNNWVRPLGLSSLDLPCHLMGTGMAFPWDAIRAAQLASGCIVEDLKLGLDLAVAGTPPVFCASAVVTSEFPKSAAAAERQRQRWEYGHIQMIVTSALQLIFSAIAVRNWKLLVLALDMAVPPLALLCLMVVGMAAIAGLAALLGLSSAALVVSGVNLIALALSIGLCWLVYGRKVLPLRSLFSIIPYVIGKINLYRRLFQHGFTLTWTRTDRN
jgi:cellulose synthase/poly-beta-1,6-N-acetylglucosamine synthase-like glycosyltransferase